VITQRNRVRERKVQDYLLQDIAKIILTKIREIYEVNRDTFDRVDKVLIELQPKVNNKMKLISHLIYGKFVELYNDTTVPIRFVSASGKLKAYNGPQVECKLKGAYARRKYLSIQYTKWLLENQFDISEGDKWKAVFDKHGKQDDLGDVFLMGIMALSTRKGQRNKK
jgi:hypothetical protein